MFIYFLRILQTGRYWYSQNGVCILIMHRKQIPFGVLAAAVSNWVVCGNAENNSRKVIST